MKTKNNAVVIIHGIGHPRPMDTLRNFVESVRKCLSDNDSSEKQTIIRSRPDKITFEFETRMLRLTKSRNRGATDFYEFYWAHHIRNNKFSDFSEWLSKLMFSNLKKVPDNLKFLWCLLWGIIIAIVLVCIFYIGPMQEVYVWLTSFSILALIISCLYISLKRVFLNLAGDAGRYFTPKCCNIESRFEIRKKGIELLRSLHDSNKYDRIIVVGHSLGSVIGYDILRFLWADIYDDFKKTDKADQKCVECVNSLGKELANSTEWSRKKLKEFQKAQNDCLEEYRNLGLKWLITDFITIGSPLCNIDFLSGSKIPFQTLVNDREYPCSPPLADEHNKAIYYQKTLSVPTGYWSFKILHNAALFAVTRWTNIYFKNDIIGGSMVRLFGKGIKDICINNKMSKILLGGHTKYWTDKINETAIKEICKALNLNEKKTKTGVTKA